MSASTGTTAFADMVAAHLRHLERSCTTKTREDLRGMPEERVLDALALEQHRAEAAGARSARSDARLFAFYRFWRALRDGGER